jgi:hypothetical protein
MISCCTGVAVVMLCLPKSPTIAVLSCRDSEFMYLSYHIYPEKFNFLKLILSKFCAVNIFCGVIFLLFVINPDEEIPICRSADWDFRCVWLQFDDVYSLKAFGAFLDFKADLIAIVEAFVAGTVDT